MLTFYGGVHLIVGYSVTVDYIATEDAETLSIEDPVRTESYVSAACVKCHKQVAFRCGTKCQLFNPLWHLKHLGKLS